MTQHMIDLSPLIVITDIRYKIDLWWLWSQKSSNADDPMYDWLISSDCNCRHIQTHMTKLMTHPKWLWSQTSSNTHDKNYDQSEVIVITDSFTHMTKCMINPWWLWSLTSSSHPWPNVWSIHGDCNHTHLLHAHDQICDQLMVIMIKDVFFIHMMRCIWKQRKNIKSRPGGSSDRQSTEQLCPWSLQQCLRFQ